MIIIALGAGLIVGLLLGFRIGRRGGIRDASEYVVKSLERDFGGDT